MLVLLVTLMNGPILCPDRPQFPDGPCEPPSSPGPLPDDDDGDDKPKIPEPSPKPEPS